MLQRRLLHTIRIFVLCQQVFSQLFVMQLSSIPKCTLLTHPLAENNWTWHSSSSEAYFVCFSSSLLCNMLAEAFLFLWMKENESEAIEKCFILWLNGAGVQKKNTYRSNLKQQLPGGLSFVSSILRWWSFTFCRWLSLLVIFHSLADALLPPEFLLFIIFCKNLLLCVRPSDFELWLHL